MVRGRPILRQFGVPSAVAWSGGHITDYCLNRLEQAEEADLLELSEYAYGGDSTKPADSSRLWRPGFFRLFMSHVSAHKQLVAEVKEHLDILGIAGFVAHEDIEPTREWVTEIELALGSCDALVAFLTNGFHESDWTDQEVGYCVARRLLVVPVRLGVDPYGFIGRYQALTPTDNTVATIATGIVKALQASDLTVPKMGPALIRSFEGVQSFAEAKRLIREVERIEAWTPEMLRSLESSVARNSQISGSWGVPERVQALLEENSRQCGTGQHALAADVPLRGSPLNRNPIGQKNDGKL